MSTRIGIDIGGTFTDLVFLDPEGQVLRAKVLSTPDDYSRGHRRRAGRSAVARGARHRRHRADHARHHGRDQRASSRARARGWRSSPPRAFATCWRSGACACRCSTTSAGASRAAGAAAAALRGARAHRRAGRRRAPARRARPRRGDRRACSPQGVDAIAVCLINAYANGAHEVRVARAHPRARSRRSRSRFERAPAGDPGVRAHQHHGGQRLRAAAGEALPRAASSGGSRSAGDREAAHDHAVERRRDERGGGGRAADPHHRVGSRRRAWSARRSSRGASAT